jgi:hypothetical protein
MRSHRLWRCHVLGRLERELTLRAQADEHDTLVGNKPSAVAYRDVTLALATLELNERYEIFVGKPPDGVDESIVNRGMAAGEAIWLPR